jgi:hypothetical protein
MLVACSKQHAGGNASSASERYEALRQDVTAMLGQNPDSTFIILDSLETYALYPDYVIDLLRGNMYGQQMNLRFAEYYLRQAICKELHNEWPKEYYKGVYNLALSLQQKS